MHIISEVNEYKYGSISCNSSALSKMNTGNECSYGMNTAILHLKDGIVDDVESTKLKTSNKLLKNLHRNSHTRNIRTKNPSLSLKLARGATAVWRTKFLRTKDAPTSEMRIWHPAKTTNVKRLHDVCMMEIRNWTSGVNTETPWWKFRKISMIWGDTRRCSQQILIP